MDLVRGRGERDGEHSGDEERGMGTETRGRGKRSGRERGDGDRGKAYRELLSAS